MVQIINLSPLFSAQRIARDILDRCGVEYFILPESEGPSFRLDPAKLARIAELAQMDAAGDMPWVPIEQSDLDLCLRMLRRELIHRLAIGMLEAGL